MTVLWGRQQGRLDRRLARRTSIDDQRGMRRGGCIVGGVGWRKDGCQLLGAGGENGSGRGTVHKAAGYIRGSIQLRCAKRGPCRDRRRLRPGDCWSGLVYSKLHGRSCRGISLCVCRREDVPKASAFLL